jgi:hypothetical protein
VRLLRLKGVKSQRGRFMASIFLRYRCVVEDHNDLLWFRFQLWKSFGFCSVSGSRQYLTQFVNNFFLQNLALSMSEAVNPVPKPDSEPEP